MRIHYLCPYWGQEHTSASTFFGKVLRENFDGVEINLPDSKAFINDFRSSLDETREQKSNFRFVAQQVLPGRRESTADYLDNMRKRLEFLVSLQPDFINSHTGKDYFSFEDNCRAIDIVENIADRSGIPIYHETHRGRFAFHASSLLQYLDKFPELKLTADLSHWCTVSESLLQDQEETLEQIFPSVYHLHARIGHEHSPQVNDPFAPEWKSHMATFVSWWKKIIERRIKDGDRSFTITPEFGPAPYMPTLQFTQTPLSDQWMVNVAMKCFLRSEFDSASSTKIHESANQKL